MKFPASKNIVLLVALTVTALSFYGCSKSSGGDDNTPAPSQICSQLTGVEGLYWDLMNGIPRTDIPGGVPIVKTTGGSFTHPSFPLLTFIYPQGYTPFIDNTVTDAIGVNLVRSDGLSLWRYTSIFNTGAPTTPENVLNLEVTQLMTNFGSTGSPQVICTQQGSQPRAPGIATNVAAVFIRFGNMTALLSVSITTQSGLGAEQINIGVTAAPTAEFTNEILNTYLPIDYQLLYKDNGEIDSDGDGFSDTVDNAPFDPTRH